MAEQIEILVVDDDKEIANLVEIYLSSTGYIIYKAYNAMDGLALCRRSTALRCAGESGHAEIFRLSY